VLGLGFATIKLVKPVETKFKIWRIPSVIRFLDYFVNCTFVPNFHFLVVPGPCFFFADPFPFCFEPPFGAAVDKSPAGGTGVDIATLAAEARYNLCFSINSRSSLSAFTPRKLLMPSEAEGDLSISRMYVTRSALVICFVEEVSMIGFLVRIV
jgi:hypothetical protein